MTFLKNKKESFIIFKCDIINIWESKFNKDSYLISLDCDITKSFKDFCLKTVDFLYPVTAGEKEEIYGTKTIKLKLEKKDKQLLIEIFCKDGANKKRKFKLLNSDFSFFILKNYVDIIDNFAKIKYRVRNFQKILEIL